jgi:hypothetical protein
LQTDALHHAFKTNRFMVMGSTATRRIKEKGQHLTLSQEKSTGREAMKMVCYVTILTRVPRGPLVSSGW